MNWIISVETTPQGPDENGLIHLKVSEFKALCGTDLTGETVPDYLPMECPMCHEECV